MLPLYPVGLFIYHYYYYYFPYIIYFHRRRTQLAYDFDNDNNNNNNNNCVWFARTHKSAEPGGVVQTRGRRVIRQIGRESTTTAGEHYVLVPILYGHV